MQPLPRDSSVFEGPGSPFGTFSESFLESVSRPSFLPIFTDFGVILGSIWIPLGSLFRHLFFSIFFYGFWGPGGGGPREQHFTMGVVPALVFSDIWGPNRGFGLRGVHFQDFRNTCSAERTDFQSVLS